MNTKRNKKSGVRVQCPRQWATCVALATVVVFLPGCYVLQTSSGGGQTDFLPPRHIDPADIALPEGYRIEVVATDLTYPTGVAFDGEGRVFVTEGGYSYGEDWAKPRLLRLNPGTDPTLIVEGERDGPWNGVFFHEGFFYVAEGNVLDGGRILRISPAGEVEVLVDNLPSVGDHHVNGPVVGPDGQLYFSIGTATNSGVVGPDNGEMGWLKRFPDFHDVPGGEIVLAGRNFESEDVLVDDGRRTASMTGAFLPFGEVSVSGQRILGSEIASGTVVRLPVDGGEPEQVAWGFRNPFGLTFSPGGDLFVTENSYDNRGSRPVWGAADLFRRVHEGKWHGWPDFSGDRPLTDSFFRPPGGEAPGFLLAEHPNDPPPAVAHLGVHSSSNGFDFSTSEDFGYNGHAFIAQWGDLAPNVNKVLAPVGYKVIRVDPSSGEVNDFAVNRGPKNGPASLVGGGGLERPIAARFSPDSRALYVVDFGVVTVEGKEYQPRRETGVVWKIVPGEERGTNR